MFLFIVTHVVAVVVIFSFKYISCSYLSVLGLCYLIKLEDLNTSHVLIYQKHHTSYVLPLLTFKYISCSYLSIVRYQKVSENKAFKYISCSYLSYPKDCTKPLFPDLNTSHVLIYHDMVFIGSNKKHNLNTSHVLIYQASLSFSLHG